MDKPSCAIICICLMAVVFAAKAGAQDLVPPADPQPDQPVELVPEVRSSHPRLLFTEEDVPDLKQRARGASRAHFEKLLEYLPASTHPQDTKFLTDATDAQRQGLWRLPTVALHYVITGDPKSFDRAHGFLQIFLDLEHWETGGETDAGMGAANILAGAALAYDWLYDDLDFAFRDAFRDKLLLQARRMYHLGHLEKGHKQGGSAAYWQQDPQNNHRWHRLAGLTLAALAVADDQKTDDDWLLAKTKQELDFIHEWLPPDGSNHESPSYLVFGTIYLALAMDAADRCLGTDYLSHPYFANQPLFRAHTLLPGFTDTFHYGDSGGVGHINDYLLRTAAVHEQPEAKDLVERFRAASPDAFVYGWFSLVWDDPSLARGSIDDMPTKATFPDLGLAFVRDGWSDDAVAVMLKSGPYGGQRLNEYRNANGHHYINVAHDDPDANTFQLAIGDQLVVEGDRYAKTKLTAVHNTILVNGTGQLGEGKGWTQPVPGDMSGMARLVGWRDTGDGMVVAEGEAGGAYADLSRFRRTVVWVEGQYVLVLDDIATEDAPAELTWLIQGPALTRAGQAGDAQYALTADDATCGLWVASDRETSSDIVPSPAEHRGKPLGHDQLRVSTRSDRWRVAALLDPWGHADLSLNATYDDATGTIDVRGPAIHDRWTIATPTGADAPSRIAVQRGDDQRTDVTPEVVKP